jgi:AcrR family transcriptional regulator
MSQVHRVGLRCRNPPRRFIQWHRNHLPDQGDPGLTKLKQAISAPKEQWLAVLEEAAEGYLDGARDPKQTRSRRRQLDLLEAATRVFARDGIAKAKMADIAAEAGISVSSIYDYYPSKEDMAYEIPIRRLAEFYAEFLAQALPLLTMRERLHLFLSMATDYARRNPDWARLLYLEIWPSVLIEEARVRRAVDDFGRIVVAMIREGGRRGEWDIGQDPYRTATILMGSITHMIITWLLYRRPENLSKATKPMVDQLMRFLDVVDPGATSSQTPTW